MGVIDEIRGIFRTGADVADKLDSFNTRSVARGAAEQSFIFPCIIDANIPVDLASVLAQNLDRVYASWTQIYLSSVGFIDLNYIKNPKQFVAKYQPKGLMYEDGSGETDEYDIDGCDETLRDDLYGNDEVLLSGTTNDGNEVLATISPVNPTVGTCKAMEEASQEQLAGYNTRPLYQETYYEATADDILRNTLENQKRSQDSRDNAAMLRATEPRAPKMSDTDVKKINDMQPYALELRLLATKGDSAFSQWVSFIVGVKTHMHLANTNVLTANIVDVLRNRNPVFNYIRWTTGEISLFKDIILHLDDINFDVANKSDRTGKYISSLKKLRKKYVKVGTFGVNRIAPFATIAISSNTYYDIKTKYGFDLKNMAFAHKVLDELFLMCFVIIDDANHTYDILVDGQSDFQTYSLETLEREVSMKSSKLSKELTRMLGSN